MLRRSSVMLAQRQPRAKAVHGAAAPSQAKVAHLRTSGSKLRAARLIPRECRLQALRDEAWLTTSYSCGRASMPCDAEGE